ncbi:phosphatase PAP2 family protein [Sphingosinicella sp. BN140058]|uniref:phosphatase PAP2 family protein n=1 Tax=Sphingosinicella sp. BN140058 TaxID=1892855 RepID=UPI0019816630|nr:phosphatase PAP2 family protein [Sphingosinicella sp. BN140058]
MNGGTTRPLYDLPGEDRFSQVEPAAGYWNHCPILNSLSTREIRDEVGSAPQYPESPAAELQILRELNSHRDDAGFLAADTRNPLSSFLTDPRYFRFAPAGAVLRAGARGGAKPIETGLELATLFEAETPGLWHRHVLNVLFDPRDPTGPASLSPPRQALVWAALDLAISNALIAAWYYKWLRGDEEQRIKYRPRPYELDHSFDVLFSSRPMFNADGFFVDRDPAVPRDLPNPSPGTPRHPAYPSGHSTYSAAASEVLACLFPDFRDDFEKLANNIGWARLWGGVHWLSDHTFGQQVGLAVARLIIEQLNATGIGERSSAPLNPPTPDTVERDASAFARSCDSAISEFRNGVWRRDQVHSIQNLV